MKNASVDPNPGWLKTLRALGVPLPHAPILARAEGIFELGELATLPCLCLGEGHLSPLLADLLPGLINHTGGGQAAALVIDASGWESMSRLDDLYGQLSPGIAALPPNGRVAFLLKHGPDLPAAQQAVNAGLIGFARSLAKELGRYGSTVNLLQVAPGAERHMLPWLGFFLAKRSAFISGQTIHIQAGLSPASLASGSLFGKIAVVTGAAQGIGLAIAEKLAEEGAKVIGIDRPGSPTLASAMRKIRADAVALDIAQAGSGEALAAYLRSHHGGLDILVNNAGITRDRTFKRMERSQWQSVLDINLHATVGLTDALTEQTMRTGGRVICLSSISGIAGNAGQTNYATAKAALIGYVQAQSTKLAKRDISINAVAPGFIETPMTASMPFMVREVARRFNAVSQGGQPGDVAELVSFMARPEASGVSGETIRICGLNLIGR